MCIVTDALLAIVEGVGDIGATDAVAAGAAGLAGAGAAGAFGGADDATASLATDATAPAADSSTISGIASPGAASSTADLAGTAGGAGSSTATLPEITVTAPSLAGEAAGAGVAGGSSGASSLLAPAGIAALGGSAGGGGSGVAGATGASPEGIQSPGGVSQPSDALVASDSGGVANPGFISTTDAGVTPLGPDLASQLGIDTTGTGLSGGDFIAPSGVTDFTGGAGATAADSSGADFGVSDASSWGGTDSSGGSNWLDKLGQGAEKYFSSPKNDISAGLLGLSLKNALTKPKLPGSLATAQGNAGAATAGALSTIQSGGTATPQWASQKSSIDATINQQIQQQTQAIMQAAASNGEGTQNSGIVQQQIAQMTQNLNVQRQNLYAQAQQQNVSAALSELSGGDATLTAIGNTQLQQSEQAQALAAQTAEMALLLQTGQKIPGQNSTGVGAGG